MFLLKALMHCSASIRSVDSLTWISCSRSNFDWRKRRSDASAWLSLSWSCFSEVLTTSTRVSKQSWTPSLHSKIIRNPSSVMHIIPKTNPVLSIMKTVRFSGFNRTNFVDKIEPGRNQGRSSFRNYSVYHYRQNSTLGRAVRLANCWMVLPRGASWAPMAARSVDAVSSVSWICWWTAVCSRRIAANALRVLTNELVMIYLLATRQSV